VVVHADPERQTQQRRSPPHAWLAGVVTRLQDHPAKRIDARELEARTLVKSRSIAASIKPAATLHRARTDFTQEKYSRETLRIPLAQSTNSAAEEEGSSLRRIWPAQEISGKSLPKLVHAVETKDANPEVKSLEAADPVITRHN
jgi:hypothetical protein